MSEINDVSGYNIPCHENNSFVSLKEACWGRELVGTTGFSKRNVFTRTLANEESILGTTEFTEWVDSTSFARTSLSAEVRQVAVSRVGSPYLSLCCFNCGCSFSSDL